jgi:type IV pilus assembly protein PilA
LIVVLVLGVGGLGFVFIAGVMAAIAIPNFIRYKARSKQVEAKATLKMLYTGELSFYAENNRYTTDLHELGVRPEPGNRYTYLAGDPKSSPTSMLEVDTHRHPEEHPLSSSAMAGLPVKAGLSGTCPKCEITLVAAGNIDSDPTLDVWSISSAERTAPSGSPIPVGAPHLDRDDVRD